jgi:putative spermidine/putrescine transport system substrate-binding protein
VAKSIPWFVTNFGAGHSALLYDDVDQKEANHMKRNLALLIAFATIAAACGGTSTDTTAAPGTTVGATNTTTATDDMAGLVAAAEAEGMLTTIALPHDWCNYGAVIDGFKAKYPNIEVNELVPDAGSADEIEAIKANQNNPGPQAPDVIDVGLAFGPSSKAEGLIQPYKVSTWDSIPDDAKDAEGYWYGDYYGVLAFEVNTAVQPDVPTDWADLLDPKYNGQIALAGDPRASNQAIFSVYASALGNGGSLDDAQPGLDFFAQLNAAGNLVPLIAESGTVASGETPVTIRWTYNALANRDENGDSIQVVVPATGRFGGVYVQAISAYAPHPNAAKLWMEYLYSDEGQLGWLSGYCNPIRYEDMAARGVVPADLAASLPDTVGAVFPTIEQIEAAKALIVDGWDATVGLNVGG